MSDAIVVDNLSKSYPIYAKPADRLKELLTRKVCHQDFRALRQVSFNVPRGSTFGIIGENGSGKSTLLQLIAGTMHPTSGKCACIGRVAALLELGSGFNPEFSGRENVLLNASILGLKEAEIISKFPEIERFAEIGDFIGQPVKTYSSGMYVRLAFAVAIHVAPEILLVDESLAVGDIYFQQRCLRKIRQMKRDGKTIVLVSHDMAAIQNLCDAALWLARGEVKEQGEAARVTARYLAAMAQRSDPYMEEPAASGPQATETGGKAPSQASAATIAGTLSNIDHRWGNRQGEILGVQLLDSRGDLCQSAGNGELVTLRISARYLDAIAQPVVGFSLRNRLGEDVCAINTSILGLALPPTTPGHVYTVDFRIQLPLLHPGNYCFTVGCGYGTHGNYSICDMVENVQAISIASRQVVYGYLRVDCAAELKYAGPAASIPTSQRP